MKPDSELLPLFAKMLPKNVYMASDGSLRRISGHSFKNDIRTTEYLSLCHEIENGLTDEERKVYHNKLCLILGDQILSGYDHQWHPINAPWQSRVTALARVKGLI